MFAAGLLACGSSEGGDTGPSSSRSSSSGSESTAVGETGVTGGVTEGGSESGGAELDPQVAACLRLNACEVDGGTPIGLQACLGYALDVPWSLATVRVPQLTLAALECKLAADDCAAVRACTPALDGFAAACKDHPLEDLCAGDTWVICDELGAPRAAMDCKAAGLGCNKDIWAGCGAETCEFGVTQPSCEGDVLVECTAAGLLTRINCPEQYNIVHVNGKDGEQVYSIAGETCGQDVMRNSLGCIGTGADCGFFSQTCDGATLETCAGGKLARRDCAALEPGGQGCGFIQSGPFAGAASCGLVAPACDLSADESCAAGQISFCDWDTPGTVDCLAAGFTGCATTKQGARTVAYCTP